MSIKSYFYENIWPELQGWILNQITTNTGSGSGGGSGTDPAVYVNSQKGQPSGLASLDSSSKVNSSQLPTSDGITQGTTNLYTTTAEKSKLAGIATGATNVTNNNQLTNGSGYLVAADITGKEPVIATGSASQYIKGDKTLGTLNQDAVPDGTTNKAYTATDKTKLAGIAAGATNVTNNNQLTNGAGYLVPSDIAGKQNTLTATSDVPGLVTALAGKEPTITAGSTAQYLRGDKSLATLNQDVVPDGTTNKAYTATEKTKLSGIATGATNVALTNNLTTSGTGTGLDAAQGLTLKGLIDSLTTVVGTKVASTSGTSTNETLTTPTITNPVLTGTMTGAGAINTTGAITTTANVTRSGFQTTDSQLKVGLLEFQSHSNGNNWIGSNVYYNTNSFRYRTSTGGAVLFYFKSSEGQFRLAVAGLQDASLPNTGNNVQMKINVDGTFAVGAPVSDTEGLYTGATFKVDPTGNTTQTGKINYPAANATAGVTGNVTNNNPSGLVRFAAAATSLTVTNSFATTSSKIFVQVTGTDTTAKTATVTKAAGSFVITLNAAATAETAVDFFLIN